MTSSRAPALAVAEASESDALRLLTSVRATLGLPAAALDLQSESVVRQLREAHALLTMLETLLAGPDAARAADDVRHNWNKALRRRGWTLLPALPSAESSGRVGPSAGSVAPDALRRVQEFLGCFGVSLAAASVSSQSLTLAHALCQELQRDVDALRALPLLSPDSYTRRFAALTARWNELASRVSDLPRLSSL